MSVDFHQGFTNNYLMNLPIYQHLHLKSNSLDEVGQILHSEINLKHPVVIHINSLEFDQQREIIGVIENYFSSHNLSFNFPYPVYILCDHESSISKVSVVKKTQELPKFFTQRESRMNVKETQLANKNKLLQQEILNSDASSNIKNMDEYGRSHRIIFELEQEIKFYHSILNGLQKVK